MRISSIYIAVAGVICAGLTAQAAALPSVVPKPVMMEMREGVFTSGASSSTAIRSRLDPKLTELGEEGYRLTVLPDGIEIVAPKPAGIFYGEP